MNQAIANIIKSQIEDLSFVDKIAGLVTTVYMNITDENDNKVQKSFPVACCTTAEDCKAGAYNDLCPNSAYKTVIYFEDGGVSFSRAAGNYKYYTSRLRLVCWINVAKLLLDECYNEDTCTISAALIAEIIRALPAFPVHYDYFDFVYHEVTGQQVHSNSIFAGYTYNEKQTQFLMYPFDYFALDIETQFAICLKSTEVYDAACETPTPGSITWDSTHYSWDSTLITFDHT